MEFLAPPRHQEYAPYLAAAHACYSVALFTLTALFFERAQETANLNWRDIDFRAGFIRVNNGKGGKDRIVTVGETAVDAFREYRKAYRKQFEIELSGLSPVFLSRRRQRITTRNIQQMLALRLKLTGIDIKMRAHCLKHSFATQFMQNGMKISEVGQSLGDASLSSTQKYTYITMKEAIDNYDMAHPRA